MHMQIFLCAGERLLGESLAHHSGSQKETQRAKRQVNSGERKPIAWAIVTPKTPRAEYQERQNKRCRVTSLLQLSDNVAPS